jgi:polysaccharide biosynthesis/export protein
MGADVGGDASVMSAHQALRSQRCSKTRQEGAAMDCKSLRSEPPRGSLAFSALTASALVAALSLAAFAADGRTPTGSSHPAPSAARRNGAAACHPKFTSAPHPSRRLAGSPVTGPRQTTQRRQIELVSSVEVIPEPEPMTTFIEPPASLPVWTGNPNSIPWEIFAQGEYIGPSRVPHLPEYRVRVDDVLAFVYRLTRETTAAPYRLKVGDVLKVESLTSERINHSVTIEPDGMVTVPIAGRIAAAGQTIDELKALIEARVSEQIRDPAISIMPEQLDQRLEELRATVDNRSAAGGQSFDATVAPDGAVQIPAIGSVPVVGLSLVEVNAEVSRRYSELFAGVEVTAVLRQRAPRHVYVLGEVRLGGRFPLVAPTTALQALSLAGGYNIGADLKNIVVLRRDDNWRLIATCIDLSTDLNGECLETSHDIWLRDGDILLLPKSTCQRIDDYIDLVLTRGVYGVVPLRYSMNYTRIVN